MSDITAGRFEKDTAEHELTTLREDGLYRHLRFKRPGSGEYWFDLVTWPHNLVVKGDMGSFHFSRFGSDTEDMFRLFRDSGAGRRINPDYWAEKLCVGRSDAEEYSQAKFRQVIAEQVEGDRVLSALVKTEILDSDDVAWEEGARDLLDSFKHEGFRFTDTWEFNFHDWTHHYLWCCHAIVRGIRRYDAAKAEQAASRVPRTAVRNLVAAVQEAAAAGPCWVLRSSGRAALIGPDGQGGHRLVAGFHRRTLTEAQTLGLVQLGDALGPVPQYSGGGKVWEWDGGALEGRTIALTHVDVTTGGAL